MYKGSSMAEMRTALWLIDDRAAFVTTISPVMISTVEETDLFIQKWCHEFGSLLYHLQMLKNVGKFR